MMAVQMEMCLLHEDRRGHRQWSVVAVAVVAAQQVLAQVDQVVVV